MNKDLERAIFLFRELLNNSWNTLKKIEKCDSTGSFLMDWLQFNWELVVESAIIKWERDINIEVYGDGADANGESSRILYPNNMPNRKIICKSKRGAFFDKLSNEKIESNYLDFDRFVMMQDGWYYELPPFDMILCSDENGREFAIKIDTVDFYIIGI